MSTSTHVVRVGDDPIAHARPKKNAILVCVSRFAHRYGTSASTAQLHQELSRSGYMVSVLPVEDLRDPRVVPHSADDLMNDTLHFRLRHRYPDLVRGLAAADIIVINGEGVLIGETDASRALLGLIKVASTDLGMPTYLVNHSCFPYSTNPARHPATEALYVAALRNLSGIAVRDARSRRWYARRNFAVVQAFDPLPLFIDEAGIARHDEGPSGDILIGGGIYWTERCASEFAIGLAAACPDPCRIHYLFGASENEAVGDVRVHSAIRKVCRSATRYQPSSVENLLGRIARASVVISGRFHHAMAAVALGVPLVPLASYTPKIEGAFEALGMKLSVIDPFAADMAAQIRVRTRAVIDRANDPCYHERWLKALMLARANILWPSSNERSPGLRQIGLVDPERLR